jgi:hypothetical protein
MNNLLKDIAQIKFRNLYKDIGNKFNKKLSKMLNLGRVRSLSSDRQEGMAMQ